MSIKAGFVFLYIVLIGAVVHAQTWKPLGPIGSDQYSLKTSAWGGGTGQIHAFAFAPEADGKYDWYCASPWGGLWGSVDEGHHWTDLNPALEQVAGVCSAIDIAIDPHSPSTIYVANGRVDKANKPDAPGVSSTGVFRSVDAGKTWQRTGLKFNFEDNNHISRLMANPYAAAGTIQLFAATDKGLFMSQSDVEKKWVRVSDDDRLFAVQASPNFARNHKIYASGDDIYVSKKDGAKNSFSPMEPSILDMLPAQVKEKRNITIQVLDSSGTDVIYALAYQDSKNYFMVFNGSKWEMRASPVSQGVYIPTADRLRLAVDPTHPDDIYVGHTYVCRTDNGGRTWQLAGKYCQPGSQNDPINLHGDIHAVDMIPGTSDVLIGTDGGIFRYMAADKKEIELNNGLNISQIVGMSAPAQAPQKIMIGKQDTGYDLFDGNEWSNFFGGDGYSVHASPLDSSLYVCDPGYIFRVLHDKPEMGRPISCKASESALFSIAAYDPKLPNRWFIAGSHISYTDDGAGTFTTIYKHHTAADQPVDFDTQIESMGIGHDDGTGESVIYATNYGFNNGNVCKMVKGRLPAPQKNDKPCNENLCSSCWAKVPLPHEKFEWLDNTSYSVSGIAVSTSDPDEVWICYEHGVYDKDDLKVLHSTDGGASWSSMDKGLPPYTISKAIVYDDKTKFLYLGTWAGVYINKNDGSGWMLFGPELPKSCVKVLEINQKAGKIRAALYGRGVWEADLAN